VLAAAHHALVAAGAPQTDRFQRVFEVDALDFRFDATYPDLTSSRGDDFVPIEILLSVGRSVRVKRKIIESMLDDPAREPLLNPKHVMVVFKETQWENWSFNGGRLLHA